MILLPSGNRKKSRQAYIMSIFNTNCIQKITRTIIVRASCCCLFMILFFSKEAQRLSSVSFLTHNSRDTNLWKLFDFGSRTPHPTPNVFFIDRVLDSTQTPHKHKTTTILEEKTQYLFILEIKFT